ncbi:outer membrane beta-barrel protein [Hymenobacter psychrotolerans]|uniref:Outer membrane receptor for ferrienterochelin and colicins n=1 Tax=Hymenobacter psychrotolerans DSM 18569 TaxID=1121959 RepID=A0A1M6SXW1_9BACT|nr:outer membrane beta-barrel protein [Hymenobacter psychrotolerans]SHK49490.1 Outer membrane receptor for ferrienterochelin and colicins [Hymenobacter psychrotolerans DSM 18569]
MKPIFTRLLRRPAFLAIAFLAGAQLTQKAAAQATGTVSGVVQDAAGKPLEFATLTLHRATDSVVVKSEFSNEQGIYRLGPVVAGRYLVLASQVGFVRRWSEPVEVAGSEEVQLPVLKLPASVSTQLKEVTVVGQKPLFERLSDRTVVNVEGSTLAAGASSLEVLGRSPGVTVDGNDNLSLRGRQGVLVLIDGKRQPMTGAELADYLRALPADQVKNIELITNPPAKYEAQGSAGIIAINLKKDQRLGTNGTLNASYGLGRYGNDKYTTGLSLNHRRKGLNLFGSYTYADRENFGALTIHRDFFTYPDGQRTFTGSTNQDNFSRGRSRSHTWKAGLDYNLSEQTVLGVMANGVNFGFNQTGTNNSDQLAASTALQRRYQSLNTRSIDAPNVSGNLNLRHTFTADSVGPRELTADADVARYDARRLQQLNTRYTFPTDSLDYLDSNQHGQLDIWSVKADYTHVWSKRLTMEAGGKMSWVQSDNDLLFRIPGPDGAGLVRDPRRSNRFLYDENINAGYVNFNYSRPGWTLQGGLRGEQTKATGVPEIAEQGFDRNYFQLFPSASVKREISKNHEVALSLSRRIDRPSYGQLNPFKSYIDATTYGAGNPDLLPQTSYNFELNHTFRQKYSIGLSYSVTRDPIIGTVQPAPEGGRAVVSTSQNLGRQQYAALTLNAPLELADWWTMTNNAVLYYNHFTGNLAGTSLNSGKAAYNINSTSSFTIGKGWSADVTAFYQSPEVYGFFQVHPLGQLTAGVQKTAWDRKGTFKLHVTDIFFTNKVRATSTYDNYVERFYQRQDSRVATLSFSYRLGNDKVAPSKRRSGGAEEEQRRAGGS